MIGHHHISYGRDENGMLIHTHAIIASGDEGEKCLQDSVYAHIENIPIMPRFRRTEIRVTTGYNSLNNKLTVSLRFCDRQDTEE